MKKAIFIKKLKGYRGDARLYKLSTPIKEDAYGDERNANYVVVSGVLAYDTGIEETYIFESDIEGNIKDYAELDGSFKGSIDHEKALNNAGYKLITNDVEVF